MTNRSLQVLDALAFSGLLPGLTAGALTWAAALAIARAGSTLRLAEVCGLAILGTVTVYAIDRLRDVERDEASSPKRSAFVSRHARAIALLAAASAAGSLVLALLLPATVWLVCGAVAVLGFFHRRLKDRPGSRLFYVTAAWIAIVVGLPAVLLGHQQLYGWHLLITTLCLALAIEANVIASRLRGVVFDADAATQLRTARRLALAAAMVPLVPPGPMALSVIGLATWLSILLFRPDERYGLVVLDGALLVGGLVAAGLLLT